MEADDRPIVGFTMIAHALFHAYELSIPIFVVVWLDAFPVSEAILGLVVGVGYGAIGLGAVPSGVLSDKYGSNRVVLGSMLGMGAGFVLISVAPSVLVLSLALIVWGAAASLYHPAGLSLLSRGTRQRGTAFAYHGAAGNIGTILGPLFASVLLIFLHWRMVAGLLALPAVTSAFAVGHLPIDEQVDAGRSPIDDPGSGSLLSLYTNTRALFVGTFAIILSAVMLYGLYYRGILTFLPEILGDLPVLEPVTALNRSVSPGQYVYAGLLAVGVAGQYAGGRVTDRTDAKYALVGTFACLVVGALAFAPAAAAGIIPLLFVCGLLGFTIYATAPIYQATIADHVSTETHGLSYGYTYLGMFGVGALGAPLSGAALAYADMSVLFLLLAGIAALAFLVSVSLLVRTG